MIRLISEMALKTSSGIDLLQRCRHSSPFDSDRLNAAQNTFRAQEMVKNVRGFFFSCVHLHVCDLVCLASKLSLWSHRTNLTDEKRERGGAVRRDESTAEVLSRGEEKQRSRGWGSGGGGGV